VRRGKLGCIVLAAGFSSRMGAEKALLEVEGTTLLSWLVERLSKVQIDPLIVIRTEIANNVKELFEGYDVVVNPKPENGRTGSIQAGIARLHEKGKGPCRILLVPIDRPGFSDSTLEKLILSEETTCPEMNGKGGHPILISAEDSQKILLAQPGVPLRELVSPKKFEVDDKFLHLNVDTQEEMVKFGEIIRGRNIGNDRFDQ